TVDHTENQESKQRKDRTRISINWGIRVSLLRGLLETSGLERSNSPAMEGKATGSPDRSLSTQQIQDHYDQFAWAYRRYWGDHIHHGLFRAGNEQPLHAQEQMLRHCASRAGLQPGMHVADVGCGHGGTASFLAREYSCRVLGLTISPTQLEVAR